MTLSQFALATQADPKWVQNAVQTLGLYTDYGIADARRLGLARVLSQTFGMPLRDAWDAAERALRSPEARELMVAEAPDGSARAVIDVHRYLSTFSVALSRAMAHEPRARGRPMMVRESAVDAGREYGIDVSLIESALRRTPEERIRQADANAEFVRAIRGRARK